VGGDYDADLNEFHTFGLLWTEDKYVFYVDGVEDGVVTENVSGIDQFIMVTTEPVGYRKANHRPTEEAFAAAKAGDTFLVDYVRVFDIVE
jgi:beta-glucanase (GH16 family)